MAGQRLVIDTCLAMIALETGDGSGFWPTLCRLLDHIVAEAFSQIAMLQLSHTAMSHLCSMQLKQNSFGKMERKSFARTAVRISAT